MRPYMHLHIKLSEGRTIFEEVKISFKMYHMSRLHVPLGIEVNPKLNSLTYLQITKNRNGC